MRWSHWVPALYQRAAAAPAYLALALLGLGYLDQAQNQNGEVLAPSATRAEGYGPAGRAEEGLARPALGIAVAENMRGRWAEFGLHRVHGGVAANAGHAEDAPTIFAHVSKPLRACLGDLG